MQIRNVLPPWLLESCVLSTYHTVAYSRTLYVKCEWAWTASLILFEGQKVNAKPHDVHLGNVLGEHVLDICNAKHDLIKRLNVLLSNFNGTYIDTLYQLFNVHCMSAYGSVLWDFSSQVVNVFYTSWRKSIRRLLLTHNEYITWYMRRHIGRRKTA